MAQSLTDDDRRRRATEVKSRVKGFLPEVRYINYSTFTSLPESSPNQPLLLIDVREPEERAVSTLPSSIPVSEAEAKIGEAEMASSNLPLTLVCFCTVGLRSGMYARNLLAPERTVYNYSVMEHIWGGGPLVRPDGSDWDGRIHAYMARYQPVLPSRYDAPVFGHATALYRAAFLVPGFLSALGASRRKRITAEEEEEPVGV